MRNWTIKEAVEEINKGNQEAIAEVAKHFPNAFMAIVKNDLAMLAEGMGEKFTLRRLDYSGSVAEAEDDEVESGADEANAKEDDLSAMSTKELMKLCDKRGIKVPHYGKNKQFYLDALQNAGDVSDDAENEDEAEEATDAYEGKSAQELFKECKKRGIKAEAKKPTKYYIALLKKADEAEAEEDTDAEGWDDGDDGEEEAPVKPAKSSKGGKKAPAKAEKPAAKTSSKSKAKAADEEDDDDDWDL